MRARNLALRLIILGIIAPLTGCSASGVWQKSGQAIDAQNSFAESKPTVVRVRGFSALPVANDQSLAKRRLMAIRASRLDAYRALTEQIYGTALAGSTQVQDLVAESDRIKAWVESYIQGARVLAVHEQEDGTVETEMTLTITPYFQQCLSRLTASIEGGPCFHEPLPKKNFWHHSNQNEDERDVGQGTQYYF